MKKITRNNLIEKIVRFANHTDVIKVISGMRRSGKSELLLQLEDRLKSDFNISEQDGQIQYYNFESLDFAHLTSSKNLYKHILQNSSNKEGKINFIFLDEVQKVAGFEDVLNSLRIKGNFSIFITGSNSSILAEELSTNLSGRFVSFKVLPFSLSEVQEITEEKDGEKLLIDYLNLGGLPGRFQFEGEIEAKTYLSDVYDSIVQRDVILRSNVKSIDLFNRVYQFLASVTTHIFSATSVSRFLRSQSLSISNETIYNYLQHITSALIFHKVLRFDIQGKQTLSTNAKYYATDLGLVTVSTPARTIGKGDRLENSVFLELLRRGYKVYVGHLRSSEIDFVAQKDGITEYYQVCWSLEDKPTYLREFGAFDYLNDDFDRFIITNDQDDFSTPKVKHYNAIDWLLGKHSDR